MEKIHEGQSLGESSTEIVILKFSVHNQRSKYISFLATNLCAPRGTRNIPGRRATTRYFKSI